MNIKIDLVNGWEFSLQSKSNKLKDNKWHKALVPGTVYHNLLLQNLIQNPFDKDNELQLQWVAESDWSYRTSFEFPQVLNPAKPVFLVFEGVDTAAEIIFNDKLLGSPDNMFRRWEYNVASLLKKTNTLRVNFISPYRFARELEKKHGRLPVALNSERVYIRKAQYSFGWDWGPSFADSGIWKPVYLVQNDDLFIKNVSFSTLDIRKDEARAEVTIILSGTADDSTAVMISLSDEKGTIDYPVKPTMSNTVKQIINIKMPRLWWPNGEGEQHLYTLKVKLLKDGRVLDETARKTGIRKIELHLKEKRGNSFHFTVNGKRIFAKGANWIPADSFLTRISKEKYTTLLTLARDADMNLIRVWGGGIYEQDTFYDLCDQLGLMVWQDFMFACGGYPEHQEFLDNFAVEAAQNITRLQHHASIALWCGNNENEWIWYQDKKKPYQQMPGYSIFARLIPALLKEFDPGRPYWESSPFSFEDDPNSVLSGNRHQWELWSNWADYRTVKHDYSLFVTEFGFQGPANPSTFEKVIPLEQRSPQSYLFEFHNKQVEGNERIFKFLSGHLPVKNDWEDYIYLAQLNQGLALKTCIEHWRFLSPHTSGTIIWQLNDCWPVSSWSLIDSDLKPKLAYYLVKKAFSRKIVIFAFNKNELSIYLNDDDSSFKGYLEYTEVELPSGKSSSKRIKLKTDSPKTLIKSYKINAEWFTGNSISIASLYDQNDVLVHRNVFSPLEWKHLRLPQANIKAKFIDKKNNRYISIKSDKPAFYVSVFSDGLNTSNNSVCLLPGEEVFLPVIKKQEGDETSIKVFSLNDYRNY